ncbi:DNA-binding transcriptional regulator, Lrp family [Pseudoduganella namucuonensis]|uniref:DNA-binding transcriptional regulator, Lrp family n=2 Tax=Pseudoduganella namucuonensis TaxID=1035707 RepID=A0A1I7K0E6_9BURK|nr:DNA-binding transcriptional regulator, Lrp family [Pseudoduganella namucuonensis]
MVKLDRFDLKILVHLQRQGRCSNVELAEAVGLSPSPCLLRTKRLQDIGVIRGYGADIVLETLGSHVVVFSEVTIGSHHPADFRKFEDVVGKYEEIVECYNVSGGYDYLLKIVAPSVASFQALMEQLLDEQIGILKFSSRIVLRQPLLRRNYPLSTIISGKRSWE